MSGGKIPFNALNTVILPLNWWHSWTYFKCHWSIYLTKPHEVESRCTRISHACCIFSSRHSFWKHSWNFSGQKCVVQRLCCFCRAGCDAAGAFAPWRPQNEEGGGHGSGLCQRDHDPHALPSQRNHHLQVQTGTAHLHSKKQYADKYCWLMTAGRQSSAIMESAAVSHEPHRWHQLLFQMSLSCSLDPGELHCSGYRRCSLWKMIVVQDNLSHKAREFQAWPCFVCDPHNIKLHVTSISAALFIALNMFNAWWDGALQILLFNILQL